MLNEGLWQSTRAFFENIMPILERPAIQRQILAICIIMAVAFFLSRMLNHILRQRFARFSKGVDEPAVQWRASILRLPNALKQTYFPLTGILFGALVIRFFNEQNWLAGLLEQIQVFFGLLFVYRAIVATIHLFLSQKQAKSYHARFLKPIFFLVLLVGFNQLLSGIVSVAEQRIFTISERDITIESLFVAGVVFYLFLVASWLLRDLLTYVLLPRFDAEPGMANIILTISHYIAITAGILSALALLGINLSSLAIIGAGLSIGIGFGLQELVANFISGILLLFEQSIRPGDVIQINDNLGIVEKLRIRSTTIRTRDNVEIIVPNQNLLTSSVTTYTHSERLIRLNISVGVSYDSEPTEVRDALMNSARRHGLVKKRPEPSVFFEGFGDSSLDFELAIWIENAEMIRAMRSDMRFIIWEELAKRGIEIPFPQRDLHIRSGLSVDTLPSDSAEANGIAPQTPDLPMPAKALKLKSEQFKK